MIKLIVDSTCDLPKEYLESYDIKTIPLQVRLNEKDYKDKETISIDEIYASMKEGSIPMTSQPSPLDIENTFSNYASQGINFIYLSFSSKLSGTYQLAYSILNELKEKYKNVQMDIVDTKSGSSAIGLMVIEAMKLIEKGMSFEFVLNAVNELTRCVEHLFTIADLKWLIKGGRLNKAQAIIGSILDIKPILHLNDGSVETIDKVRGKKKALNTLVELVVERIRKFPDQIIGISHADDIETAELLSKMLTDKIGETQIIINKIGSVLGTHIGIGGVGVFFFNKKPSYYLD